MVSKRIFFGKCFHHISHFSQTIMFAPGLSGEEERPPFFVLVETKMRGIYAKSCFTQLSSPNVSDKCAFLIFYTHSDIHILRCLPTFVYLWSKAQGRQYSKWALCLFVSHLHSSCQNERGRRRTCTSNCKEKKGSPFDSTLLPLSINLSIYFSG